MQRWLKWLVLFGLVVVMLPLTVALVGRAAGGQILIVKSGSMGRAIPKGSLVVAWSKSVKDVAVGDVLLMNQPESYPILHRVVSREDVDGQVVVQTRGDANPTDDPTPFAVPENILVAEWTIPVFGFLVNAFASPFRLGLILCILASAYFAPHVYGWLRRLGVST